MTSKNLNANQNQLHRSMNGPIPEIQSQGSLPAPNGSAFTQAIPLPSRYLQPSVSTCPPLPVRRAAVSPYSRMGMGSYYSPYSRYPTSMYSPGFGGYRMSPFGGGFPAPESSSFVQMAEESTRPAFESIESVVEVVSSISMMLESTYQAVYSSYSAILGVVDQFSRLKDHLAQFLSTLALLRALRWFCLKVLYLLRLRKENPSDESAWSSAEVAAGLSHLPPLPDKDRGSAWPFLMFLGLVIGAPWLMFKLLSKTVKKNPLETRVFRDEQGRLRMTTAAYNFKATQRDELSFSAGEKLFVSPNSSRTCPKGWAFACNQKHETGLVPLTYMTLKNTARSTLNPVRQTQQVPIASTQLQGPHFDYATSTASELNAVFDISGSVPENFAQEFDSGNVEDGKTDGFSLGEKVNDKKNVLDSLNVDKSRSDKTSGSEDEKESGNSSET